jgi:hypothetical protein
MKKILWFTGIFFFSIACSDEDDPGGLTAYQESVVQYFQEVALGFEFGTSPELTRKWRTGMNVFVGGDPGTQLSGELQKIIGEINALASDGFRISLTTDTLASNVYLFFGSAADFADRYPPASSQVAANYGLFHVFYDAENYLYRAVIYVDIQRAQGDAQRHLLREELTQALGLARDSPRYPESIFQQAWTTTTTYSKMDKDLIRLLYHPGMLVGLSKETSRPILTQLAIELGI